MNEPRVWKWMVPALLAPCVFVGQIWLNVYADRTGLVELKLCGIVSIIWIVILFVQAAKMYRAYYGQVETDQFVARREALATNVETKLFEAARGMHSETVRLLLLHRTTIWRIKETPTTELADFVLDADPRVHWRFVEYVLQRSSTYSLMPKHGFLADKSFDFDPTRKVTDREQYDALHKLLINRQIVTEAHGNQPGQFLEPWTPELVARRFGMTLEMEDQMVNDEL